MAKTEQGVETAFENGKNEAILSVEPSKKQSMEGVNPIPESFQDIVKNLNGSIQDMLGKLSGKTSVFKEFSKDLTGKFSEIKESFIGGFESILGEEGPLGSMFGLFSKPKAKTKLRPTTSDLVKLDGENASGALLLYWKLDDIENKYLSGKGKKESSDRDGGKGIFSKIFGGVGKAAGGLLTIGIALIAFAGAALLFSQIPDMGKALVGLGGFAFFVWGTYSLAQGLEQMKAAETFKKFAITLTILVGAFLLFSVALLAASYASPYIPEAVGTVLAFIGFIALAITVARILNESKTDLINFSLGVLALTGAFLLMSVAFIVASYIPEEGIKKGMIVLGGVVALTLIAAIAGKVAEKGQQGIQSLAIFMLTLTGALLLVSVACIILSFIEYSEIIKAGVILGGMIVLGVIAAVVGKFLSAGMFGVVVLGAFSIALALALNFLLIPLLVIKTSGIGLETVKTLAAVMLASVGLGVAAAALGVVFANPLVMVGLALATAGFAAISIALLSLIHPVKILSSITAEKIEQAKENLTKTKDFLNTLQGFSIKPPVLIGFMFLTATLGKIAPGVTQLVQLTNQVASVKNTANLENKTKALTDVVGFLNTASNGLSVENISFWKNVAKITTPLSQFVSALSALQSIPIGNDLNKVIDGLTSALNTLGTIELKGKVDKKAIEALSGISKAFNGTIQVVQNMANLDSGLIPQAKDGISQIAEIIKDFNQTMASTVRVSQKQTQSIVAIQDLIRTEVALVKFIKFLTPDKKEDGITVPQINSASEAIKSIGWVVVSLNNNLLTQLKKVDPKAASNLDDVILVTEKLTNGNFIACLSNLKTLDFSGLQIAAEGLNRARIDGKTLNNLKAAVNVVESFDASKIQTVGNALGTIAGVSRQIHQVANDISIMANNANKLEKVAASFERMARASQNTKAGIFNVDFLSGGKVAGDGNTAAAYRGKEKSNEEKELEKIYNLLASWYAMVSGGAEPDSLTNRVYSEKVTAGLDPFANATNNMVAKAKEEKSGWFGGVKSFFGFS